MLSKDPLTGNYSISPDLTGKPVPRKKRALPENPICYFCHMNNSIKEGSNIVNDSLKERELMDLNDDFFIIENNWPILSKIKGDGYLVISRAHLTSLDKVNPNSLPNLANSLNYLYESLLKERYKLLFLQVGVPAGSSIAHLHLQGISSPVTKSKIFTRIKNEKILKKDLEKAEKIKSIIYQSKNEYIYLPASPSTSLEFRIFSEKNIEYHLYYSQLILKALEDEIGDFNYNLFLHPKENFSELIVKIDYSLIYERYFALALTLVDPATMAKTLREKDIKSKIEKNIV